ncbi:MAG: SusC/RagA family TonB-linked outer membrane protein [Ferruginibacter sp.]
MRKIAFLFAVLVLSTVNVLAQYQVKGKITDVRNGTPLPGASVKVKGTAKGVSANQDGTFTIDVSQQNVTLEVSVVGFLTETVLASAGQAVSIALDSDSQNLNEVIVTALNIKREKRSLTYATETINSDQLNKSGTGNPLSELSGKASGLTVINSSGDPGSGTYIRLRGVTSITGDNQPLMVVDGVPIDNSINSYDPTSATPNTSGANSNLTGGTIPSNRGIDINPNDIESITVLKGPAATALYGIKAASGALIITTKKGVLGKQKTSVSYNSSASWDKTNRLPELQDKYSQGSDGIYAGPTGDGTRRTTWGAALDTLSWDGNSNVWDPHGDIVGNSSPLAKIPVTAYDRYNFFQTGLSLNNNIALTGGSEKTSFRVSLGNVNQTGISPNSKYNKTNFGLSGQAKLTEKLHISGSLNYTVSANDKVQQGSNTSGIMLGLLRTPPNFDNSYGLKDAADIESSYVIASTGGQRNYRGGAGYDNPFWTVNRNPFKENLNRVFGNVQATYQLLNWMSVVYRLGADAYSQDSKNFYDINSNAFPAGKGIINEYFNNQYNSDLTVNMQKKFSGDFSGSLVVGHNYFYNISRSRTTVGDGLIAPKFFDIANATSYSAGESDGQKRTSAFYGEAQLTYQNMLFLDVTGRRETSSTLPKANRNFFYPSVGLGWVFTELPALKGGSTLSFGKLRLSYAQVGKDAPVSGLQTYYGATSISDGFTSGIQFPVNNGAPVGSYQITSTTSVIGNPDLKPEKTASYEVGVDLGFLKNRINLTGTYYYSKTSDAIFTVPYTYTTGFSSKLQNAGKITNEGLEISLNTTPVKTSDFSWDLNFNWSKNKNLVTELYSGVEKVLIAGFQNGEIDAFAGKPFGQIYGSAYVRSNSAGGKSGTDGTLLINDDQSDPGFGKPIAAAQNAIIGDINPDWQGSVTNNLTFRGITFGFQIDVRHGGDIWNGTRGALSYFGTSKESEDRGSSALFAGVLGHLDASGNVVHFDGTNTVAGPGAVNATPSAKDQYYWQNIGSSFVGPSETGIEDGSFIKLRQVSLGYTLPRSMLGKTFNSLSLTVFANNIILHTKYSGVDPETSLAGPANGQGLDYFNNPGVKNFGVRLNVGL